MRSLFKKMAHKKRAPRASSSTNADPMHQEDHQCNEDARARDVLHHAFGHANIDAARVGEGPSNPHVIPSSIDTGDESKASYDEQGDFRSADIVRGSIRGAGLIQHKCIFSRIMSDRIGARLSST
ncbi:hypothetical protein ZOSMA_197G00220 [Zostera marina]|uniref:Uncharacterized protein n=1 Tax=Zostera marina TaxID=29655 RepID=A0A0K9PNX9_ZOSMR|nr:hypothetical protein ZOSMA_197G00220 [Zostera marina]